MRFEKSIEIAASQQRVWDVLSALEAWPQRIETVDIVELVTPAPITKGSRVRLKQPRLPEGTWDVTVWDAPSYFEWTQKTGGIIGSICDPSFEQTLLQIAAALNTLRRVFPLSLVPDASTLTVKVNGVEIPQDVVNGWKYRADTNSISFLGAYVPPPGAILTLQYAISSPSP